MKKLTQYQILSLLLPVQILLVKLISHFPNSVERYYSNGIYPLISKIFRFIFGWVPFSVGDIFYFLLGLFLLIGIVKWIKSKFRNTKQQLFKLGAYLSVFYFLFHILWGLNYYRNSLYTNLQLEQKPYTVEDLDTLTKKLIDNLEYAQSQLVVNDSIAVVVPYSNNEILKKTKSVYTNFSESYPEYNYKTVSLKKSLFSLPLSYMGFSGYLNPIFGQAQVNSKVPKVSLPAISCHEVAHQLGIGFENEANFIGFLAASKSNDYYFKYSAYIKALRFSIAGLYYMDEKLANEYIDRIPKGVLKNIKESEEFWMSYQNKLEPFFKIFYDGYLKVNQQKEGMKTYSRMIDLLIAYDKKYGI